MPGAHPDDAERFGALGAPRIGITGNFKLDVPPPPADPHSSRLSREATRGRDVVAAASTHPGEESAMIEVHRRLTITFPALLTIIAPRHPHAGRARSPTSRPPRGSVSGLRSRGALPDRAPTSTSSIRSASLASSTRSRPIVFMGGSLVRHGGQNPIEAIRLGAAILHGPHVVNFDEIYDELDGCGGAELVTDAGTR